MAPNQRGFFWKALISRKKHKGAQNPIYFSDPSVEEFNQGQKLSNNSIVKIALVPEREGTNGFIQDVIKEGVLVSLAHTDANSIAAHTQ